jgi:hypothetical protein
MIAIACDKRAIWPARPLFLAFSIARGHSVGAASGGRFLGRLACVEAPNGLAQRPHETSVTCAGCSRTTSGKIRILGVRVKGGCPACDCSRRGGSSDVTVKLLDLAVLRRRERDTFHLMARPAV